MIKKDRIFTAGPWRIDYRASFKKGRDNNFVYIVNDWGGCIASFCYLEDKQIARAVYGVGDAQCFTNARIMSASLELLAACKASLKRFKKGNDPLAIQLLAAIGKTKRPRERSLAQRKAMSIFFKKPGMEGE